MSRDDRHADRRGAETRPRRTGSSWGRRGACSRRAACAVASLLLFAACGGGSGAAETDPDVNPVEAVMAIDDVRVAGVPLGPEPPAVDTAAGAAPASGPAGAAGPRQAETGTGRETSSPPGAAAPAVAARITDDSAPPPLVHLQPGAPLVVDMEVADATAGSEVGVVWYAPDGREVWRQKRPVGDEPRLGFSADTTGWPVGLYRGEIRYGRVPVHQFAVQVGTPAPRAIVRERFPGPHGTESAGPAVSGQQAARTAAPDPPAASSDPAAEREAASAAPGAPRARDEAAAASETIAAPVELPPLDEGAPVVRVPPDDPNMVAPEGPPGPAPEAPPEPPEPVEDDEDGGDDEPPPRRPS